MTLMASRDRILPKVDKELAQNLTMVLKKRGVEFVHKLLDVQVVVRVRVIQEDVVAGIKVVNRERSFSFKHRAK